MNHLTKIFVRLVGVMAGGLMSASAATAGDYYVYSCTAYGNTAPAFSDFRTGAHLDTGNECQKLAGDLELNNIGGSVAKGYGAGWRAYAPPGVGIVGAYTPVNDVVVDGNLRGDGFTAEYQWAGGTQPITCVGGCGGKGLGFADGINNSFASSSWFGWTAGCSLKSFCSASSSNYRVLGVHGIRLTAQRNLGPSVIANGANNLWYQASRWIRGAGFPVTFTAHDPSGICGTHMLINGQNTSLDNFADFSPNMASFTQCPASVTPTGTLDTSAYPSGALAIEYTAENAARVPSSPGETLHVDNIPVTLALSTPNDPDPNVWVNHYVPVIASPTAGPSGVAGTTCTTNNGAAYSYPATGVTLNGTGVWTVSCTSWNNAYDVANHVATSPTLSVAVHIDETPPAIDLQAVDPSDPQAVVADTSDAQAGVAGGQIAMRRARGGAWQTLPTRFTGSHLLGRFDDALLPRGAWVIRATSCDRAGNCASTAKAITLPVRAGAASYVGFGKIINPLKARKVKERIRVGWHYKTVRRHGHKVRIKVGGHFKTITVIKRVERCTHKRVRGRIETVCHPPRITLAKTKTLAYGKTALIGGIAVTSQGVPLGNQPIAIATAPDNGLKQFRLVRRVRTNANGGWQARLPVGPSRLILAIYPGSATVLPAIGRATLKVPAQVAVVVTPHRLPWAGTLTIHGHLVGGYIPPKGVALRLLVRYPHSRRPTPLLALRTNARGEFSIKWSYHAGRGVAIYPMWIATTATETDYPFTAGASRHTVVTFGVPTPHKKQRHKKRRT